MLRVCALDGLIDWLIECSVDYSFDAYIDWLHGVAIDWLIDWLMRDNASLAFLLRRYFQTDILPNPHERSILLAEIHWPFRSSLHGHFRQLDFGDYGPNMAAGGLCHIRLVDFCGSFISLSFLSLSQERSGLNQLSNNQFKICCMKCH